MCLFIWKKQLNVAESRKDSKLQMTYEFDEQFLPAPMYEGRNKADFSFVWLYKDNPVDCK